MQMLVVNTPAPAPAAGHSVRLAAAAIVLATVIASAATVAATPRPALAADAKTDELPQDPNHIESLTPEQARKLASEFPGVEFEIEIKGHGKVKVPGCLPLNGLESLDTETAKALAKFRGDCLSLNGLTTLSDDTAKALAQFRGDWLSLNGLTALSDDAAKTLAEFEGAELLLNDLTRLSDDAVKALAESQKLSLESLMSRLSKAESVTPETVRLVCACANPDSEFSLSGLIALDTPDAVEIAQILATVNFLSLPNLKNISADAVKALAKVRGDCLSLNGLTTLSGDTAKALAVCNRTYLQLNGLTTLSADAAKALAEFRGAGLFLDGLTTLSDEASKALAEFKGERLSLRILMSRLGQAESLTPEAARLVCACAKQDSEAALSGLNALDSPDAVEIAQILATAKGRLALPNLKKISPKTLTALIGKTDVMIPPLATLELIPEPDGSPTDDFVLPDRSENR